jgi:hypothetical protein
MPEKKKFYQVYRVKAKGNELLATFRYKDHATRYAKSLGSWVILIK